MKERIHISEYSSDNETRGVISCEKCNEDVWCNIPDDGDLIECDECNTIMEFYE